MDISAHFSEIPKVVLGFISQAEREVLVATAWFTDEELFNTLCKRSALGVSVSVVLVDDSINRGRRGLNFQRLSDVGGQVVFVPSGSKDESLTQHKFCVIDGHTVITGSYNWSRQASINDEDITVITDAQELAGQYLDAFQSMVARCGQEAHKGADYQAVRRRLELIRNLVLLEERESIETHLQKLRPAKEALRLEPILSAFDKGDFSRALKCIADYLQRSGSLVQGDLVEISRLKLQLQTLELRLEAISDEHAELERQLTLFHHRHDEALGKLIQQVLQTRAAVARLEAELAAHGEEKVTAQAKAKADEARAQEYSKQQESIREATPIPELDPDGERKLKQLYRKACNLCHPDKVTDAFKVEATATFQALQEAYRTNDLDRVAEIYESVKAGAAWSTRSTTLSEVDALKVAIAQMEHKLAALLQALRFLRESDAGQFMERIDGGPGWEHYVVSRRCELEEELNMLEGALSAYRNEVFYV